MSTKKNFNFKNCNVTFNENNSKPAETNKVDQYLHIARAFSAIFAIAISIAIIHAEKNRETQKSKSTKKPLSQTPAAIASRNRRAKKKSKSSLDITNYGEIKPNSKKATKKKLPNLLKKAGVGKTSKTHKRK